MDITLGKEKTEEKESGQKFTKTWSCIYSHQMKLRQTTLFSEKVLWSILLLKRIIIFGAHCHRMFLFV